MQNDFFLYTQSVYLNCLVPIDLRLNDLLIQNIKLTIELLCDALQFWMTFLFF